MSSVLLKNVRLFDPGRGLDFAGRSVLVKGERIESLDASASATADEVVDGRGRLLTPGLIDLRAHLCEPGFSRRETIASGLAAATAGGFTSVVAMPTTKPAVDRAEVVELILSRAADAQQAKIIVAGAFSEGREGKRLAEMAKLAEAGCACFTDGDRQIQDSQLLRYGLETAEDIGTLVMTHAEDESLSQGGVMHEGVISTRLGLAGSPGAAEVVGVARDLAIAELTGARLHIGHVSTAAAADLIRQAKRRGIRVTAEVSPLHLWLTEDATLDYDTSAKVFPPLRPRDDVDAMIAAVSDGTIDAVASDHCPQVTLDKNMEFNHAAAGAVGLESVLGVVLSLVNTKRLTLERAIAALTRSPAQVLGRRELGRVEEGGLADLVLIDPDREWRFTASDVKSKCTNTPLIDAPLVGRAVLTIVDGRICYREVDG